MGNNFTFEERSMILHLARKELKNISEVVAGIDRGVLSQPEMEEYNEYMSELEGILRELGSDIRREDFIESEPELSSKKMRDHDDPCL